MKARLFKEEEHYLFEPLQKFSTHFYEARFGAVVEFCVMVSLLRGVLREFWSLQKLERRGPGDHPSSTVRLRDVNKAVTSPD